MATGIAYRRFPQGTANIFPLGSAANPSVLFGNESQFGGLNDGIYATTGPAVGIAINGTSVVTFTSAGMATGAIATTGNIATSGSILSSSATGGIGYATGAGGSVTQSTDKSTAVTLNTVTGIITMNNAALGSDAIATFTVTNSAVGVNDVVLVNHGSAGTAGSYHVQANSITAGSFKITVHNFSGSSLSEAIVLHFAVIQGVQA